MADSIPSPRACVQALTPYASARRTGPAAADVWLNANEGEANPDFVAYRRYPEFQPAEIVDSYAAYAGVDAAHVLVSRGADEAIDLVIRAYCEPGQDRVLILPPTYGMYAIAAETLGVGVVEMPRRIGEAIDASTIIEEAKAQRVRVVFLCTPNNPTGELIPLETIEAVAQGLPECVVVVDEAYFEFGQSESATSLIGSNANLVVLRTLSKAFGLAGVRVGFSIAKPELRDVLAKVLAPYPVPVPVAEIAASALSGEGIGAMKLRLQGAFDARDEINASLRESTAVAQVFASAGNFVTFEARSPSSFLAAMREAKIAIRDFSKSSLLPNTLRVSVGNANETAAFLKALRGIA